KRARGNCFGTISAVCLGANITAPLSPPGKPVLDCRPDRSRAQSRTVGRQGRGRRDCRACAVAELSRLRLSWPVGSCFWRRAGVDPGGEGDVLWVARVSWWVSRIAPSTETHHRRGLLDTSIAAMLGGVTGGPPSR